MAEEQQQAPVDGGEEVTTTLEPVEDQIDEGVDEGVEGDDPPAPASVEDIASRMGWSPKENWRGDPDKWKPADEFLTATVDVNRSQKRELSEIKQQVEAMARTSAAMTERAIMRERERLAQERRQAFDEGDAEAFDRAGRELRALESSIPQTEPQLAPEAQAFVEKHAWVKDDPAAGNWAFTRAGQLAEQGIPIAKQLEIVEREAKQYFPEHFKTESKPKGQPLSNPGARAPQKSDKKGFSQLPAEVKKQAINYEKRGVCSRDDFAATYWEESAQ